MSKTRIAVLIAALFLGTQVGMAALDEEYAAPTAAESESAQPLPAVAEQSEQPAVTEQSEQPAVAEQSEQPAVAEQSKQKASSKIAAIRDRVSNFFAATRHSVSNFAATGVSVLPRSTDESQMLPALARYLEQRAASITLTGAPGNVFPASADEPHMLPALAQYLDGKAASINLAKYDNSVADLSE